MKKVLFLLGLFLLIEPSVFADSASIGGTGSTVQIMNNEDVQMVNEVINITLYDGEKYAADYDAWARSGYVGIEVTYNFENLTDEALTVNMGFPEYCHYSCNEELWFIGGDIYESYILFDFAALDGDEQLEVTYQNAQGEDDYYDWYLFDVDFDPGETKSITNTYWVVPNAYKTGDWVDYTMDTGASWAGVIEQVDAYVYPEDGVDIYGINHVEPEGFTFDLENNRLEWHFYNLEPDMGDNLHIEYEPIEFYRFSSYMWDEPENWSSSYLLDEEIGDDYFIYSPEMAEDGNLDTAWVEGADGDGVGEWVKVWLDPDKTYYGANVFMGYGVSEELWEKNNRVKKAKFIFSNGESAEVDFVDEYRWQDLSFSEGMSDLEWVTVEILEVYEGSEFDDTAIADVDFKGLLTVGLSGGGDDVFSDVLASHPNRDAILALEDLGVIDGYPDGTFQPDGGINRAELMKMVVAMMMGEPNSAVYKDCFSDVSDEWFASYVCYAETQGWVDGYSDGSFKPGNLTNRAEAVKIILNAYFDGNLPEIDESIAVGQIPYDIKENEWYYPYFEVAVFFDLPDYQHTQTFHDGWLYFPGDDMTRKEVAQMIYNMMEAFVE